jgi:hypothetical protein
MNTLLRILNSFLLAGMLAVLILIFLRVREPISVKEPVAVQGWSALRSPPSLHGEPLQVEISNTPLEVEISR